MRRISTLDGWRGVAILLVIAEHVDLKQFGHQAWANLGPLGVDIFFVLSGYVITARLIDEREKTSTISLSAFYIRRAFRILPLVVCYLGVLCLLSAFLNMELRASQVVASLFFFRNYQYVAHPQGIYTTHFWSLSIEEHFYLLWPVLLFRFGSKRGVWIAVTGAVLCGTWRCYDYFHPDGPIGRMLPGATSGMRALRTDARLDGLLLGCALAILLTWPSIRSFILRNFPKEAPLLCANLLILNGQSFYGFQTFTNYLLVAIMVASSLVVKEGLAYQWLNSRLLVGIGTISYSLYIWQQLFLPHPENAHPLGILGVFPLNLGCAFLVASCSYYCMERPTARLGRHLAAWKPSLKEKQSPLEEMVSA